MQTIAQLNFFVKFLERLPAHRGFNPKHFTKSAYHASHCRWLSKVFRPKHYTKPPRNTLCALFPDYFQLSMHAVFQQAGFFFVFIIVFSLFRLIFFFSYCKVNYFAGTLWKLRSSGMTPPFYYRILACFHSFILEHCGQVRFCGGKVDLTIQFSFSELLLHASS